MTSLVRTNDALLALEKALCEQKGSLTHACHSLSINPLELHQWLLADPEVSQRIRTAQMIGYSSLEAVAINRAVHGVTEDVYYQGEVVGQKQVYSDGLLQTVLKARVPGYGGDDTATHGKLTVNVNVMPRAHTYEEWLVHRTEQLALPEPDQSPAAEPAEEIVYAEYSSLPDLPAPELLPSLAGAGGQGVLRDVL